MPKLESNDFIRTSLRLPKPLVDEFDEITTNQGLNRSNAVAQLMVRYINEQKTQQELIKSLSNPKVLTEVLNNLDPAKLEMLQSLQPLKKK